MMNNYSWFRGLCNFYCLVLLEIERSKPESGHGTRMKVGFEATGIGFAISKGGGFSSNNTNTLW